MFNRLCITAGTIGLALILFFGRDVASYLTTENFVGGSSVTSSSSSESSVDDDLQLSHFHELAARLATEVRARMVANTRERIEILELEENQERLDTVSARRNRLEASERRLEWIIQSKEQLIEQLAGLNSNAGADQLSQLQAFSHEIETKLEMSNLKEQTTTALHFMEEVLPVAVDITNHDFAATIVKNRSTIGIVEEISVRD